MEKPSKEKLLLGAATLGMTGAAAWGISTLPAASPPPLQHYMSTLPPLEQRIQSHPAGIANGIIREIFFHLFDTTMPLRSDQETARDKISFSEDELVAAYAGKSAGVQEKVGSFMEKTIETLGSKDAQSIANFMNNMFRYSENTEALKTQLSYSDTSRPESEQAAILAAAQTAIASLKTRFAAVAKAQGPSSNYAGLE